ncbi:hypothetical protein DL240_02400 [Lujinxingia litoralis]|uniref:Endonuclease/exonuclease/phosphatase domain-containing protein n=1 Tax=Lujinxingia litoralis TaxID=2211119 RepID=A0A328C9E0_9DELT|nr:endonuclease/exonuclease/phosphatase family protein [Lujinxingia litoralis]RAL25085.1 hypothetical protein DL240_02400 [Lujinxingia litoralis]
MTQALRLMTYNIRLGIQQGLEAIADVIQTYAPDVVALQEVGHHWSMGPSGDSTGRLSQLTGLHYHSFIPAIVHDIPGRQPARYGQGLLSRWPIAELSIDPLPQHNDEPRRLARASIESPAGPIEVWCTHLSYKESDRPAQGAHLEASLRQAPACGAPGAPLARFVMGDFNEPEPVDWMSGICTLCLDPGAPEATWTFPADAPDRRIDFVLGQGARPLSHRVLDHPRASDHRPVLSLWEV